MIQESDSTVSYYSRNDVVKTALVWIDSETNTLYIRTTEGFSPLDRLNGLMRSADGSPVFTKLPEPKLEAPRKPRTFREAQLAAERQYAEALSQRGRARQEVLNQPAPITARDKAARAARNRAAGRRPKQS